MRPRITVILGLKGNSFKVTNHMIRNAKDLSPDQKLAIESLIGHALSEQDHISVRRFTPVPQVSDKRRQEILSGLESHFARVDAQRPAVSAEEAAAIIDEALRSTRPNYQPIR